jgi:predicted dehydrogenase
VLDYALFLLGQPAVETVSASTYDLLGTNGFGSSPSMAKTSSGVERFDVEDLASAFLRLSDGGTLLVEASWAAHRQSYDEFGITLFGTEGGADLRVVDMEPIGTLKVFTEEGGVAAESVLKPAAGLGHEAVVERFLEAVRNGGSADGAMAADLARVVDACYRSARERREITLA